MDYVRGESLWRLGKLAKDGRIPPRIAVAIVCDALEGLHAAHAAKDETGTLLRLVHRDVSPQNILVGIDGTARVLDFGVAKAEGQVHSTRGGQLKGKLAYMPPEQLEGQTLTRAADIYAMGIVLFEALTGERMWGAQDEVGQIAKIMRNEIRVPSQVRADLDAFDEVVRRATAREASDRFTTAREMVQALERRVPSAPAAEVAEWVEAVAGERIHERLKRVEEIERSTLVERVDVLGALAEESTRKDAPIVMLPASSPIAEEPQTVQTNTLAFSSVRHVPRRSDRPRWPLVVLGVSLAVAAASIGVVARSGGPMRRSAATAAAPRESVVAAPMAPSVNPPPESESASPAAASTWPSAPPAAPSAAVRAVGAPAPHTRDAAASCRLLEKAVVRPSVRDRRSGPHAIPRGVPLNGGHLARSAILVLGVGLLEATPLEAADARHACVQAANESQELREQGKLVEAREKLVACAQSACPSVLAKQCTTWLQALDRDLPSVTFRAKVGTGNEVVDVRVFIDGLARLEMLDGRAIPMDPGIHKFRYVRGEEEQEVTLAVRVGEQNRVIDVRFADPHPEAARRPRSCGAAGESPNEGSAFRPSPPWPGVSASHRSGRPCISRFPQRP